MATGFSLGDRFLRKGDIIDVVAPASACSADELRAAIDWLKQQGYVPRFPKDMLRPQNFLAHSDAKRFAFLKKALEGKDSKAIWCLRGGYGSIRLLPELLKMKAPTEKFFIGLSDITVLHQFLTRSWNWRTIHGPILARATTAVKHESDYRELFGILTGELKTITFENLRPLNAAAIRVKGKAIRSRFVGGNLATFCSMLGTPLDSLPKNYFLFFEDIAERGYKVDRMLQQLWQSGSFKNCRGVFFGAFIKSEEPNGHDLVPETIKNFFKAKNIPAFSGIESDHGEKQRPLILNAEAELNFVKNFKIVINVNG